MVGHRSATGRSLSLVAHIRARNVFGIEREKGEGLYRAGSGHAPVSTSIAIG